jgi:hypothetical protein
MISTGADTVIVWERRDFDGATEFFGMGPSELQRLLRYFGKPDADGKIEVPYIRDRRENDDDLGACDRCKRSIRYECSVRNTTLKETYRVGDCCILHFFPDIRDIDETNRRLQERRRRALIELFAHFRRNASRTGVLRALRKVLGDPRVSTLGAVSEAYGERIGRAIKRCLPSLEQWMEVYARRLQRGCPHDNRIEDALFNMGAFGDNGPTADVARVFEALSRDSRVRAISSQEAEMELREGAEAYTGDNVPVWLSMQSYSANLKWKSARHLTLERGYLNFLQDHHIDHQIPEASVVPAITAEELFGASKDIRQGLNRHVVERANNWSSQYSWMQDYDGLVRHLRGSMEVIDYMAAYAQALSKKKMRRQSVLETLFWSAIEEHGMAEFLPSNSAASPEERALKDFLGGCRLPVKFIHTGQDKTRRITCDDAEGRVHRYLPDFQNVEKRKAIEMDAHPNHHSTDGVVHGQRRDEALARVGWDVLHVVPDELRAPKVLRARIVDFCSRPSLSVTGLGVMT